ncbi:sulfate permease 1 [Nadsonia fulvescens var. elongata DSM 6958]|uniref:Sulfate permease 1 n=1 Tax=Nadsonia fulvescens var. elongata DSM 6958 TaxID=857566 RepID=A0A1E3PJC1_9ASCO|nr:sulfate permease 1 [Nadsonia fulvescens var. elongata DSM 6958]
MIQNYPHKNVRVTDYASRLVHNPVQQLLHYLASLFPIATWIYRYNLKWLYGDLIAGITVGCVVVPQGMSYAQLATLPAEYGLYSSFVGVFVYCFFATSKDVSIGPVAVMSLQVSKVIAHVQSINPSFDGPTIATVLALLCGAIAMGIGLIRLGFVLEFIPIPAVMGFMTGSALNIIAGQVPKLLGIASKYVNTRESTYLVIIDTLKNLKHCKLDAAFGLVCLFILYAVRFSFNWLSVKYPRYSRWFFYSNVMRNGVVIIFATLFSWLVCRGDPKNAPISIIKTVPSGLRHVGAPTVNRSMITALTGELPVSVVILLLEHIAISKSFGRVNDYKINPDQELIAIGVTNLIGTLFNAYPATGSFSRSALKSKCGVRTPLAGIFTGIVVLLALYALTGAFYWIPNAALSAIIIHAVGDLIAPLDKSWAFWRLAPLEAAIFIVAVIITTFVNIEAGIYFSIAASLVVLLWRVAKPSGHFLGKVKVYQVVENSPVTETRPLKFDPAPWSPSFLLRKFRNESPRSNENLSPHLHSDSVDNIAFDSGSDDIPVAPQFITEEEPSKKPFSKQSAVPPSPVSRQVWVPLDHAGINPSIHVLPPSPGVLVFRPCESFTYPNSARQTDRIADEARKLTRRGVSNLQINLGDRPWNDPGPRHRNLESMAEDTRPILRAVVLDFSVVAQLDMTGVQALVDLKGELSKYADRDVEFHFASVLDAWSLRALVEAGFGGNKGGTVPAKRYTDLALVSSSDNINDNDWAPMIPTDTPFFHLEIPDL